MSNSCYFPNDERIYDTCSMVAMLIGVTSRYIGVTRWFVAKLKALTIVIFSCTRGQEVNEYSLTCTVFLM